LESIKADTVNVKFIVATSALKDDNEVHVLRIDEKENDEIELREEGIFAHSGEVYDIETSAEDPNLFITSYNLPSGADVRSYAAIWKITGQDSTQQLSKVEASKGQTIKKMCWIPESSDSLMIFEDNTLKKANIEDGVLNTSWEYTFSADESKIYFGQCDPLQQNLVAVTKGKKILIVDSRDNKIAIEIPAVGFGLARTLCYNPFKLHHLASGGDDCKVKFWDCRMPNYPVISMKGHSHWVQSIKYHPTHDEFIISSGSDGKVLLWNINSISSTEVEDKTKLQPDRLVKTYEEHDESVYSIAWSTSFGIRFKNFNFFSWNYLPFCISFL